MTLKIINSIQAIEAVNFLRGIIPPIENIDPTGENINVRHDQFCNELIENIQARDANAEFLQINEGGIIRLVPLENPGLFCIEMRQANIEQTSQEVKS